MEFIAGVIWGGVFVVAVIFKKFDVRRKMNYFWECPKPGCGFKVACEEPSAVLLQIIAEKHELNHEGWLD